MQETSEKPSKMDLNCNISKGSHDEDSERPMLGRIRI